VIKWNRKTSHISGDDDVGHDHLVFGYIGPPT
jgi:hypothetical protein